MADRVDLSIATGVATIRLNRPERLNAFDACLHRGLRDALSAIEADPSLGAVILTGTGRGFCAGQDLAERASAFEAGTPPDLGSSLRDHYNPLIRRLAALPCPVIAAVNGIASGAGAALALACDMVMAAESARFQFGFLRVALGPDSGVSWLLPRRVGEARALALTLTSAAIEARAALAMGLCDQVVGDDALQAEAAALARHWAGGPDSALRTIKRLMRTERPAGLEQALAAEQTAQKMLGDLPDYREAVLAFAAKRAPRFAREELQ